jgi:hypothetical protein
MLPRYLRESRIDTTLLFCAHQDLPEDQCVFIRGYRVTRTLKIFPKQIKAAAEPSSDPDEHSSEPDLELTTIPANTKVSGI